MHIMFQELSDKSQLANKSEASGKVRVEISMTDVLCLSQCKVLVGTMSADLIMV